LASGERAVACSIQGGDGSAQVAGPFPSPLAAPILAGMAGGFTSRVFIGRAEELRRLAATLDRAEQEQPQVVLLAGDAGMGKTRLLLEFADRAQQQGSRVLVGGCVELGDIGLAYLPVVDALRGLVDDPEEADLVAEVAATAPGLLGDRPTGVVEGLGRQ
jgi:AAA ATPase domain